MFKFKRWIPALILMVAIFLFSSTPSKNLPNYGSWDLLVKKGGHVAGYSMLSAAFWYGFKFDPKKIWLAWVLAVLYAISDEFHQSFTPGRHPSWVDALGYDGGGAALGLAILVNWFGARKLLTNRHAHPDSHG